MKLASSFVACARLLVVPWMAIATISEVAIPSATAGQPLPADAKYRGKTLEEWSFLQSEWLIATLLGGQSLPDTVQQTRFLPASVVGPGNFEFDVVVPPGTGLVLPPMVVYGERYEDGTFDDPNDPFLASLIDLMFNETQVDVSLDGKLVLSGTPAELGEYAYGFTDPLFFDEPILYEEPQDRGGINAVAALWTFGVGAVFHPLSPGEHTLQLEQDSPVFGSFQNTYNISVVTPAVSNVPEPTSLALLALSGALLFARRRSAGSKPGDFALPATTNG